MQAAKVVIVSRILGLQMRRLPVILQRIRAATEFCQQQPEPRIFISRFQVLVLELLYGSDKFFRQTQSRQAAGFLERPNSVIRLYASSLPDRVQRHLGISELECQLARRMPPGRKIRMFAIQALAGIDGGARVAALEMRPDLRFEICRRIHKRDIIRERTGKQKPGGGCRALVTSWRKPGNDYLT